jgi:ferredoxin--NADP+ reductase
MNDVNDDLANYYDQPTFKAFQALSERPLSKAETALEHTLKENAAEAWRLIREPTTYVYLAGIGKVAEALDKTMIQAADSEEVWHRTKQKLQDEGRWSELIYS